MAIDILAPEVAAIFWGGVVLISIWSLIWKGIALWKCGRNKQLVWFIFILVLNTAGILPIIYLWFFQRKTYAEKKAIYQATAKQVKKKKR